MSNSLPPTVQPITVLTPSTTLPTALPTQPAPITVTTSTPSNALEPDPVPSPTPSQRSERSGKPKDTDFPPYSTRPLLADSPAVTLPCPHMYDVSRPVLQLEVPAHWAQFQLRPHYLGGDASDDRIDAPGRFVYYDAFDPQFYYMDVPNPRMTLWLLIKNITFFNGGYVKRRLVEESIKANIQMRLVNPNRFDLLMSATGIVSPVYMGQPIALPDAVIPRVGANVDYFGLAVMRQLETLGVKVFNPSASIEISRDKLYTHQVLAAAGIPIPKSVLSRWPFDYTYIERHFGYPVILKATSGSKGDAVWKIDSREQLTELMSGLDTSRPLIFQEFLSDTKGRDLRCFVVGNRVVAAMMRIAQSGFKANVHQGGSVMNVVCGEALSSLAVDTAQLCLLDCTGVDVLLDRNSYKICEVNSSPGFQGLEKGSEVNVGKEVVDHAARYVDARKAEGKGSRRMSVEIEKMHVPVADEHKTLGLKA